MKNVYVVDRRYHSALSAAFGAGAVFLPSVCCEALDEPVSCHPDMVLFNPGDGIVVCEPSVYEAYRQILSPFGVKLVQGKRRLCRDYPGDIAYNVLQTAGCAFARWDQTEETLCNLLDGRGIRRIPVAQGYSRCSALTVGDGVITADPSIGAGARKAGLTVLTIRPGHILLPGYDCGFIGGASGLMGDTVVFFGGLDTHPDGEAIKSFIHMQGFCVRDLPGKPLIDTGTIFGVV